MNPRRLRSKGSQSAQVQTRQDELNVYLWNHIKDHSFNSLIQSLFDVLVQYKQYSVLVFRALNAGWKAKSFARGRVLLCSELEHLHFRQTTKFNGNIINSIIFRYILRLKRAVSVGLAEESAKTDTVASIFLLS